MLRNELPDAFRGVYDPVRYRKSQQYLKINLLYFIFKLVCYRLYPATLVVWYVPADVP